MHAHGIENCFQHTNRQKTVVFPQHSKFEIVVPDDDDKERRGRGESQAQSRERPSMHRKQAAAGP
jgi:hypothetical protein